MPFSTASGASIGAVPSVTSLLSLSLFLRRNGKRLPPSIYDETHWRVVHNGSELHGCDSMSMLHLRFVAWRGYSDITSSQTYSLCMFRLALQGALPMVCLCSDISMYVPYSSMQCIHPYQPQRLQHRRINHGPSYPMLLQSSKSHSKVSCQVGQSQLTPVALHTSRSHALMPPPLLHQLSAYAQISHHHLAQPHASL